MTYAQKEKIYKKNRDGGFWDGFAGRPVKYLKKRSNKIQRSRPSRSAASGYKDRLISQGLSCGKIWMSDTGMWHFYSYA